MEAAEQLAGQQRDRADQLGRFGPAAIMSADKNAAPPWRIRLAERSTGIGFNGRAE